MGGIKSKELPQQAAARELHEETNLTSPLVPIGLFCPIPGLTPQRVHVFATTIPALSQLDLDGVSPDMDDIVERRLVAPDILAEMIGKAEVSDGFTLSALAVYWANSSAMQ